MRLGWLPRDIPTPHHAIGLVCHAIFRGIAECADNMNSFVKLIGPCSRSLQEVLRRLECFPLSSRNSGGAHRHLDKIPILTQIVRSIVTYTVVSHLPSTIALHLHAAQLR